MNRYRRTGASLAAAVLMLTAAACGGSSETEGSGADGPITLRMTVWTANEDQLALLNEIGTAYTASNPDVKIAVDPIPFDNYTTTLTTQLAGGKQPDLAWVLETSAKDFVSSGVLHPLDETLGSTAGYELDDLAPKATSLWTSDGKLMAYPFSTSPFGVYVNTDLVAEAGRALPAELEKSGTWTWEAALDTASASAAATGRSGLVVRDFDYKNWPLLATFWRGWGADAWSEDGRTCGFDSPEMQEAMTVLHQAIFERDALPAPGVTADFFAGEAVMTVAQISRAALLEDATFEWDLLPLPTGPAGEYAVVGQAGIGVMAKGENVDAAAAFLAFLSNPENAARLAQYFPPPRTSLLTTDVLAEANPLITADQLQAVVIDGVANGEVLPNRSGQAEIAQTVRSALDPLWQPGADVEAVLSDVCAKLTPLLAN